MIDTMRFKIEGDKNIYNEIRKNGIERLVWDYVEDTQKQVSVYQMVSVQGQIYEIFIQSRDYNSFFIEFSFPKVLLDTNIFMVYPKQFANVLLRVYESLENYFGITIPPFDKWTVQRVDYCYAWKFSTREQALWILHNLAKYQYPRKGVTIRDTSLTIDGTTEKIIFYLKEDEFKNRDFRKLIRYGYDGLANYLLEQSRNVLRFEITHKKPKLISLHGRNVSPTKIISSENIIPTLSNTLKKFCNSENLISTTYTEALEKIYENCSGKEAFNLVGFLNMWYPSDFSIRKYNRKLLKKKHTDQTFKRYKDKLKELDIGVLVNDSDLKKFDLSIPSKSVINFSEDVAGIAEAILDLKTS